MSTTRQRQTGKTEAEKNPENLPPKRESKTTQDVRAPLSGTSLSTVIYSLAALGLIWGALSAYRIVQLKADAGGWYNLALGRRPDTGAPVKGNPHVGSHKTSTHNTGVKGVEDRIRALADELGIHPRELASAIRPLMPTASASSISAEASATPMADAVIGVLGSDNPSGEQQANGASSGFPDLGTLVGLDDPAPGLDG
ncbi:unnamed protein product [Rhizoctonia solani]|uniref:Transmembrane protein n=1 Tax=Rhizoctonia solani TaxID=456999 RepID=A0A8H7H6A3_9AGAM|nr:hypothetical protein RHS04_07228 [Rhizoctonia solani]KAF8752932.1 hypothetical protein RHS01_07400 [Rhizoctonia solani]CAE6358740.1 unnamed protein product [Rhizoctonia solani]